MTNIPEKMMAAVIEDKKRAELRELSIPELKASEVLIRIEYCLLCTWGALSFMALFIPIKTLKSIPTRCTTRK